MAHPFGGDWKPALLWTLTTGWSRAADGTYAAAPVAAQPKPKGLGPGVGADPDPAATARSVQATQARRAAAPQSEAGTRLLATLAERHPEVRAATCGSTDGDALVIWCPSRFQASELASSLGAAAQALAGKPVEWRAVAR